MDTAQKLLHPGEKPPMAGLSSHIEKKRDLRKQINHHIHIKMTEFSYACEDLEIYFSLFSAKENLYVSEKVLVLPPNNAVIDDKNGAIFLDVGNLDQIRDLHLVCHVIKNNKMGINNNENFNTLTSSKKSTCFRRPYACAVMNISKIITKVAGTIMDFEAKLNLTDDKDFYHLHEHIVKKITGKFSPVPGLGQTSCVKVSLRFVGHEFVKGSNLPEVRRVGFPNVIMPGEVRNDLYVTLDRGNFDRGGKTASRNIEVSLVVIDQTGKTVENCIFYSSGSRGSSRSTLPILYHNNSPIWNETVRFLEIV